MTESRNEWPERLSGNSSERNQAINELRLLLINGLRASLFGRWKHDDAFVEDIVQQSLVRIIERLSSFNGRSQFMTWAIAITIRIACNEMRRREWKNVSIEALNRKGEHLEDVQAAQQGPVEAIVEKERYELIYQIIEEVLTSRQRKAVIAELNGMPQEEIARQLGCSRNAVYKLFHDARKAIR